MADAPIGAAERIAGEVGDLVDRARALRDGSDDAARAVLDGHLAVLGGYAARLAWARVPDSDEEARAGGGASYVAALRRVSLSPDDGLAAIARHCLRSAGRLWSDAAGSARSFALPVVRAGASGRDGTLIELHVPPELRAELSWRAGQHLIVTVQHGGVDLQRHYSICAPAAAVDEGRVCIAVRRVSDGLASPQLVRAARAGAVLEVGLPAGDMVWPAAGETPRAILLVAAGSGVTPLYAIAAQALADSDVRVGLLVVERAPDEVMLGRELAELRARYGTRFGYAGVWTRGPDGRPTADSLAARLTRLCGELACPPADVGLVYLCGPDPVTATAEAALRSAGCTGATVHSESFTSDRPAIGSEGRRPGGTLRVALADGEHDITLQPGESLLAAMLRTGVDHPFSCLSGICKTCRVTVTAGAVGPDAACLGTDDSGAQVLACIAANRIEDAAAHVAVS